MKTRRRKKALILVLVFLVAVGLSIGFSAGQKKEAVKVITLWTGYSERIPVYNAAADDYMKENPSVKFEISYFKLRECEQKYSISLPAGTAPDLHVTGHVLIQKYAADEWIDPTPDKEMNWLRENFDKVYLDALSTEGKIYGIPDVHGFQVLYHNLDHYQEVGLSAPPDTLDELMSHARKLVKYDDQGNMIRSGVSLRLSGGGAGVAQKFEIFLFANGGSVMEPTGPGKWKANFANEAGYKALNFYLQALHKHKVDGYMVKHDMEAFVLGNTSQFNRETHVIGESKKQAPDMNYGIAQVVKGDVQRATNLNADGWIFASSSKNKDIAWDFAKYLNKDKYLAMMMRDVGWICTRKGVDYSEVYQQEPHFEQALTRPKDMKLIVAPPAVSNNEVYTKFSSRIVEAYTDASMLDNRDKIMKLLQEAAEEANQILKSNNEYGE